MVHIFAGIISLVHYIELLKNEPEQLRLDYCPKSNPWRHGGYFREADRINPSSNSLNPVFIQRYYCSSCHKTSSVLPECIPPYRWYLWEMQQYVLLLTLSGLSAYAVAKATAPSRQTIKRWVTRFTARFRLHKDALCTHFHEIGRHVTIVAFWQAVFQSICLGAARLCFLTPCMVSFSKN
jgi:transposase-like protein